MMSPRSDPRRPDPHPVEHRGEGFHVGILLGELLAKFFDLAPGCLEFTTGWGLRWSESVRLRAGTISRPAKFLGAELDFRYSLHEILFRKGTPRSRRGRKFRHEPGAIGREILAVIALQPLKSALQLDDSILEHTPSGCLGGELLARCAQLGRTRIPTPPDASVPPRRAPCADSRSGPDSRDSRDEPLPLAGPGRRVAVRPPAGPPETARPAARVRPSSRRARRHVRELARRRSRGPHSRWRGTHHARECVRPARPDPHELPRSARAASGSLGSIELFRPRSQRRASRDG